MQRIDNTELLEQAHTITEAATTLLERLERDLDRTNPDRVRAYEAVKCVIENQSLAIRRLVEQQLTINDLLNNIIDKNPNL